MNRSSSVERWPAAMLLPLLGALLVWALPRARSRTLVQVGDLLVRAGAENVCAGRESRYPVVASGDLPALRPDVVLLPSEPFAFSREHRRAFLEERTFGQQVQIVMVDGKNFCWHGSRSGRGLAAVAELLMRHRRAA